MAKVSKRGMIVLGQSITTDLAKSALSMSPPMIGMEPFGGTQSWLSNFVPVYASEMGADDLLVPTDPSALRRMYEYFYESDELVGQAIDIHTEVPLSRFILLPPKAETEAGESVVPVILKVFNELNDTLDLMDYLIRLSHQYWLYGEAFPYHEVDPETNMIKSITLIDPDIIYVEKPTLGGELEIYLDFSGYTNTGEDPEENTVQDIEELIYDIFGASAVEEFRETKKVRLNTDPMQGSFIYPFLRSRSLSNPRGASILHRVMRTLVYRDQLRSVQSLVTQRNLVAVHLITVDPGEAGVSDEDISDLMDQVNMALNTPDFAIITDHSVSWEIIRGADRIPDFTAEFDQTSERLMIGLGLTPELLKGEGLYSSGRLSLEILNLRYKLYIERIVKYLEEIVYRPIAMKKGFIEKVKVDLPDSNEYVEHPLYPRVSFSRTTLYDSESTFEMLWNMYLQGVISLHRVMDLLSIDYDIEMSLLAQEFGSIANPMMKEVTSAMSSDISTQLIEKTNLVDLVVSKLKEQGVEIENVETSEESSEEESGFGFGGPEEPMRGEPGEGGFEQEEEAEAPPSEVLGPMEESPEEPESSPVEETTETEETNPSEEERIELP